jgi:hypothetical protein
MKIGMQLAALVFLVSTACFATGNFSGYLVDSNCYETMQRNTSHGQTDMNRAIKYCAPTTKTRSLGLVQQDGKIFRFDSDGNAKAAELVRNTEKQGVYQVALTGSVDKNILRVDSISMAK